MGDRMEHLRELIYQHPEGFISVLIIILTTILSFTIAFIYTNVSRIYVFFGLFIVLIFITSATNTAILIKIHGGIFLPTYINSRGNLERVANFDIGRLGNQGEIKIFFTSGNTFRGLVEPILYKNSKDIKEKNIRILFAIAKNDEYLLNRAKIEAFKRAGDESNFEDLIREKHQNLRNKLNEIKDYARKGNIEYCEYNEFMNISFAVIGENAVYVHYLPPFVNGIEGTNKEVQKKYKKLLGSEDLLTYPILRLTKKEIIKFFSTLFDILKEVHQHETY